ncbi:MAG: hypothetical protein R3A45_10000 [Bdellovibrionota bacterium]|nr:hypothetical protein [Deltaproteobacteria bacterium]
MKSPAHVKTVFDVKSHAILRNLYDNQIRIDPEDSIWQRAHLAAERKNLLEQTIVNQYIKDNRVNIDIEKYEEINAQKKITLGAGTEKNRETVFKKWGITENVLQRWIRERLYLEKFLQTHPPFQAIVTERKIQAYYSEYQQNRFLGKSYDDIKDVVEQDYKKSYLQTEFKKWIDQEIRRQKWTIYE